MSKNRVRRKSNKSRLFFYCICAVVLLLAIGRIGFHIVSTAELRAKLVAIRADGYPTTIEELNDYYPEIPTLKNADKVYAKAFLLFNNIDDKAFHINSEDIAGKDLNVDSFRNGLIFIGNAPTPVPGEILSVISHNANQQFITGNSEYLKTLKLAAEIAKCRFPRDQENGFIINYDHLDKLKDSIKTFAIATILAAEAGDGKLATENILTMLKICSVVAEEPLISTYSVKMSLISQTIQVIEYTLSMIELDSNSLNQISRALKSNLDIDNQQINRSLAGARVMNTEFKFWSQQTDTKLKYHITQFTGTSPLNKLKILKIYDSLLSLDKNNIAALKKYSNNFGTQLDSISSSFFLVNNLTIQPIEFFYRNLIMNAQINGAIISLGVERFQQKYHKLPEQLTQLVPEFIKKLPNDPFSGKPFHYFVGDIELPLDKYDDNDYSGRYKSTKIVGYSNGTVYCIKRPGWMVYSYGRDQDDDNGVPMGFLKPALNGDITFRCVRTVDKTTENKVN